jgi:hypothetical protein
LTIVLIAGFATATSAQETQALRLVRTIPLHGVTGRLDHMGVDLEKKRLFVAAVANNTLEVVDLAGAKVIKSLAGFKDTQDALFLGGDFNKLYVSSLDGHVRVFQGESFWPVRDFKVEPDPNRLFYDPSTNLIYFGYGGQNAGFDAYERVGILQPKRGAGDDELVADKPILELRGNNLVEFTNKGQLRGDVNKGGQRRIQKPKSCHSHSYAVHDQGPNEILHNNAATASRNPQRLDQCRKIAAN